MFRWTVYIYIHNHEIYVYNCSQCNATLSISRINNTFSNNTRKNLRKILPFKSSPIYRTKISLLPLNRTTSTPNSHQTSNSINPTHPLWRTPSSDRSSCDRDPRKGKKRSDACATLSEQRTERKLFLLFRGGSKRFVSIRTGKRSLSLSR